ncbi:hypothetical protein HJB89_25405 [Rhizobium sp. NZLR8]|uniref:hypothetical protein n=1 Tax=Rhizobium sp. NZLR8 TaxID=2731104 RepID=UPI001C83ECEB|nr:hypothetical protein [Rhizobium sp. NZLR8]MBX5160425.1 hypothetical protein [Rhizobium sp. NZLR8]
MPHPDLSKLTNEEIEEYTRRKLANCRLYGLTLLEAETAGDGRIARVASACAIRDVKNRRQRPGSTR